MPAHLLLNGRLQLYRRKSSPYWQCATDLGDKNWRVTTREADFARAKDVAEDWYWTLLEKFAAKEIKPFRRFRTVAEVFLEEFKILTVNIRSPQCAKGHKSRIDLYLNPFFGGMPVDKIKTGTVLDFRVWRCKLAIANYGKPAARGTLNSDIITLRMILATAERNGWIDHLPDLSEPFPKWRPVSHRAWFSPEEYTRLCRATWAYVERPPDGIRKALCQQLHDYVVFMANTGLRPDEAGHLEFRDVTIDENTGDDPILRLNVRGKRGVGYAISMPSAARAFERLCERRRLATGGELVPTDKLFALNHRVLFNRILGELDLKTDRDGRQRSASSLRHTYICFRLLNGANIYHLSKNCRTSVGMIEKYYASHISTSIDTTRLNVGRGLGEEEDEEEEADDDP
jgi:integrase